jgi:iron complex transport system substrate-binding protein
MRSSEYRSGCDDEPAGRSVSRRSLLGSLGTLGTVALAGCQGGSDSEDPATSDERTPGPATATPTATTDVTSTTATDTTATPTEPREVEDATGRTVAVPSTVEDVVAVGPGMLNLVAYLDATDMLVGVEEPEHTWARNIPYNIANPELQDLPVIGPHKGGDPELIAGVDPDIVLATYFTAGTANDLQGKIDTPVVVVKAESRDLHRPQSAYQDLRFAADILGTADRAETVVEFFEAEREQLASLRSAVSPDKQPTAYFAGRSSEGGAGATSTQHPFAPFSFVDAENVATSIDGHASVSEESLLTWDPEYVFVSGSNLDRVTEAFSAGQYANLTAVQEENLYALLPTRFYGNLYGNTIADAYYVGSVLYPDAFEGIDPVERANDIYRQLFGTAIYDQVADRFTGFEQISL